MRKKKTTSADFCLMLIHCKKGQSAPICSVATKVNVLTSDRAVGGPGWDDISSLVEQDICPSCAQFLLWHNLHTAVVITVPVAVHGVPTIGCFTKTYTVICVCVCVYIYTHTHTAFMLFKSKSTNLKL